MKGEMVKGSVRNGGGLLAGLLRCGRCGRKLKVLHNGQRGVARYVCNDASVNHGRRASCMAFGNMRIDAAVSSELLRVIAPAGLEAALAALAEHGRTNTQVAHQKELALEQARYEAARAHRQYDAVDPANRLVASDLERRWNDRLAEVARPQDELHIVKKAQPPSLSEAERAEMMNLGARLPLLWNHPSASAAIRKRILRAVLEEIAVTTKENELRLALHWKGGDHTARNQKPAPVSIDGRRASATERFAPRPRAHGFRTPPLLSILNRLGVRTAQGILNWTEQRVSAFRNRPCALRYIETVSAWNAASLNSARRRQPVLGREQNDR